MSPTPAHGQRDDFVNGSGASYAQVYRAGPTTGRLSLSPILGLSLADYLNTVGRAETKLADWAGIGVSVPDLPENTPALRRTSKDSDAAAGVTEPVAGTAGSGVGEMYVRATKAPTGESRFRFATFTVPGLLEARDSESSTLVGLVDSAKGKVREARSTVKIGHLSVAGGLVALEGLRWTTLQRTGATKTVEGSFTIEGAAIGGMPLPIPAGGAELESILGPINGALAPTGFAIRLPEFENRGGQASVGPLSLDVINSPLGRQFLAPALAQIQPIREPVADAIIGLAKQLSEANPDIPDATVAVLLADITLGIFAGSSQLHVELGGVTAFTEGEVFDNPFIGGVDFEPPKFAPPKTITTPGTLGRPGTPGTPADAVDGEFAAAPLAPGTRTVPGDKGGVAVAVGLIGFAVTIGLAAADWYRMRGSRRLAEV